jgi:hypothetical protein
MGSGIRGGGCGFGGLAVRAAEDKRREEMEQLLAIYGMSFFYFPAP